MNSQVTLDKPIEVRLLTQDEERAISLHNSLCNNNPEVYYVKQCDMCFGSFDNVVYKNHCGRDYCDHDYCKKGRVGKYRNYFKSYFLSVTKSTRAKWLHIALGFPRVNSFTKEELSEQRENVKNFLMDFEKEYGRAEQVGVLDIAKDDDNEHGKFYIHFHLALRVLGKGRFGSSDYKKLNKLGKKHGLKFNSFGFKYPRKLADYFAKRKAGVFEHEQNNTDWSFSDEFTTLEFVEKFYRVKRSLTKNFNSEQVKKQRKLIKKFGDNNTPISSTIRNNERDNIPRKTCQHCGNMSFIQIFIEKDVPPDLAIEKYGKKRKTYIGNSGKKINVEYWTEEDKQKFKKSFEKGEYQK